MTAMQLRALIVDGFREAVEKKLFWIMTGLSVLLAMAMAMVEMTDTRVIVLFGLWEFETDLFAPSTPLGRAMIGEVLATNIGKVYIGFAGIIIALIATSGTIPALMERGAIDVVLAKPISRTVLLLGKFVGSLVFILIQAGWFVLLTFLVAGIRWHYWQPWYLLCIPLIVVLFSYLYACSVLFGVMTRSAMASLLLTGLAWIAFMVPQMAYGILLSAPAIGLNVSENWIRAAHMVKQVVPKTGDIIIIAGNLIGADESLVVDDEFMSGEQAEPASLYNLNPALAVAAERRMRRINPWFSIGTSLAFETVVLALAVRKFRRAEF